MGFKRLLLFLSLFIFSFPLFADRVYLKNGRSIEGIIMKEGAGGITVNIGSGTVTLDRRDIDNIYRYSASEQGRMMGKWSYRYYLRPEFVSGNFKDVAEEFKQLESLRGKAVESKKTKDAGEKEIARLDKEIGKLESKLAKVSRELTETSPDKDIERYNSLVQDSNTLSSKVRLAGYNKEDLQKQMSSLDKNISEYVNELRIFKHVLSEKTDSLSGKLSSKEEYFLAGINKQLTEMEGDFKSYPVSYNSLGSSLVVRTLINGLVTVNLVVDTGASLIVIPMNIADKADVKIDKNRTMAVTLADGRKVKAFLVILDKVKVGEVELSNVRASVLEKEEGGAISGLLGMSFLKNFSVKIDAKNNKLILEKFNPD